MTEIGLKCERLKSETWREMVERYASAYGLEKEALAYFDSEIKCGTSEQDAAWEALYDWDLLEVYNENT